MAKTSVRVPLRAHARIVVTRQVMDEVRPISDGRPLSFFVARKPLAGDAPVARPPAPAQSKNQKKNQKRKKKKKKQQQKKQQGADEHAPCPASAGYMSFVVDQGVVAPEEVRHDLQLHRQSSHFAVVWAAAGGRCGLIVMRARLVLPGCEGVLRHLR